MATWGAYKNLLLYILHLTVYLSVSFVQWIIWRWSGVTSHLQAVKSGKNYEASAQLLKVWSRGHAKIAIIHYRRHFIATHSEFVHPETALQPHITLMTVTDKEAIFCVADENDNLFDVRKYPFLFDALYNKARYLLVMPISSLLRLGEGLSRPSSKVIWIHHPGRCGSTALSQAFNVLPNVVSISEPHCLFSMRQTFKQKYLHDDINWQRSAEYKAIFQTTVKLILKSFMEPGADVTVVKATPMNSITDADLIYDMCPEFIQIFMYRDAQPQVVSLYRALVGHDLLFDITHTIAHNPVFSQLFPNVQPLGLMYNCCDERDHVKKILLDRERTKTSTLFGHFVVGWAETCYHYIKLTQRQAKKGYSPMPAFKFEHLRADLEGYLSVLFEQCGLDLTVERLRLMKEALTIDSQKDSYMSQQASNRKKVEITTDMVNEANRYMDFYQMPLWGSSLNLSNTVTTG